MILNLFCKLYEDKIILNRDIEFLKSAGIVIVNDLSEFESISTNPIKMMKNDYLYNSFVIIHKKENTEYISFSKIFILYLLSLILVWILIFKTNYFNLLLKNKLFKFPK